MLSIIAAVAENGAIGYQNRLIYRLSADLRRFKQLTTGHTIVMGRRTFESLPKGALPNRRNIVLSRTAAPDAFSGAETFTSLQAALAACAPEEQVFIIGGESVYAEALPLASRLYLTHVKATPTAADAFFPPFPREAWRVEKEEAFEKDEKNEADFAFVDYCRV